MSNFKFKDIMINAHIGLVFWEPVTSLKIVHFAFKFKANNSCIISLENFTNNVILTLVVLKYYIVASLNPFYGLGAIGKYYNAPIG